MYGCIRKSFFGVVALLICLSVTANSVSVLVASEPIWTATADALWLHRSEPNGGILAFNTANIAETLNASDIGYGSATGFDLSLTRKMDSGRIVELRFFEIDDWSSNGSLATTPNELLQFNSTVPFFALSGSGVTSRFDSKLLNTEVNLFGCERGSFRGLLGFRYMELDEQGELGLTGAAVPFSISTTTANRLYGLQTGLNAKLVTLEAFDLDLIGKAGLYGNARSQNSVATTGFGTLTAAGQRSRSAFVGELGLVGTGRITSHLSIRGGYRMLWIDGVALASDQLASTDFFNGTGISSSGDVFYQGGFLGLSLDF